MGALETAIWLEGEDDLWELLEPSESFVRHAYVLGCTRLITRWIAEPDCAPVDVTAVIAEIETISGTTIVQIAERVGSGRNR